MAGRRRVVGKQRLPGQSLINRFQAAHARITSASTAGERLVEAIRMFRSVLAGLPREKADRLSDETATYLIKEAKRAVEGEVRTG